MYREIIEVNGKTFEEYIQKLPSAPASPEGRSQPTALSEVQAIDLTLKVIALVELLHDRDLIHTNLCPQEIFLNKHDIEHLCFQNLYHASWDTKQALGIDLPDVKETLTKFDMRTRQAEYLAPEHLAVGSKLR